MWQYNNVTFIYSNPVDSVYGEKIIIPYIVTYIKSKYALNQALRQYVTSSSYLGSYSEIDERTIKSDKPFKV